MTCRPSLTMCKPYSGQVMSKLSGSICRQRDKHNRDGRELVQNSSHPRYYAGMVIIGELSITRSIIELLQIFKQA